MKPKKYFLSTILVILISAVLSLLCLIIANLDKTPPNTFILGRPYSRLTHQQVKSQLQTDFILPSHLQLQFQSKNFELPLASISAQVATKDTADNLFPVFNFHRYLLSFFTRQSFPLEITYDQEQLTAFFDQLSFEVNKPFVPAELNIITNSKQSSSVVVKPGQLGVTLDQSRLQQSIVSYLTYWQVDQPISLPVETTGSLPSADQLAQTKSRAENLLSKKLLLNYPDGQTVVDNQTLISWLSFDGQYQLEKINQYVDNLNQSLKRDPTNATFKFENNQVLEFTPAADGFTIDQLSLISSLQTNLSQLIDSKENSLALDLPLNPITPQISTESVNDLGIKELLGRGSSTFKHSNATRNFNIAKGAAVVNRILVAPGDTFSFIKNLGEVTTESGFKKAYIIRQGKTELDVGGGICQVSTTLFRAMLNAGVNIIERQNHAYRVSYYEEDMPPGYDATVFIPSPDLKFINDTGHYVLVQNIFDGQNKKLTYEIYGTSDGRQAEISNYRRWGQQPAPPTRYIDDPTLPPGKVVQDEHAIAGLKTAFDWKVTRNGQILHQKTFQSNFVPWAAVYRRGPTQ